MEEPSVEELEARLDGTRDGDDPSARVDALNALSWKLRHADAPRANALATEAQGLARQIDYPLGQARATRTLALSLAGVGELNGVFELGEDARRLFDLAGDPSGRAASRDFLASLREAVGDLAGGLELALDALSIAREAGDDVRQGYALANVGGILAASGEVDAGVERLQEGLQRFERAQSLEGMGTICARLARVLLAAGRPEEAKPYAHRCVALAEQTTFGGSYLIPEMNSVLAQIAEEEGDLDRAAELYGRAFDFTEGTPAAVFLGARAKVDLGTLRLRQGRLDAAEAELAQGLALCEGHTLAILIEADAHGALADLREQQGRLDTAIAHLREAWSLRARIIENEAQNKLAQVEARAAMESAKKDAEIHRLRFVELAAMQSELVETERMALLGRLAAGTSHELNTPLGALRSNAKIVDRATAKMIDLLGEAPALAPRAERLVEVITSTRASQDEAVDRIAAIAEVLGRFTDLDRAERRSYDVRGGLQDAVALLSPTLPESITLELELRPVPEVDAWPRELNHGFLTVIERAIAAIEGSGAVLVETAHAGQQVVVRVHDSGPELSEEELGSLFDVTFSEGDGRVQMHLGLSTAYAAAEKHGGTLDVRSTPDEGTTVTFRLPVA